MAKKINVEFHMHDGEIHPLVPVDGAPVSTLDETISEFTNLMAEGGVVAFNSAMTGTIVVTRVKAIKNIEIEEVDA